MHSDRNRDMRPGDCARDSQQHDRKQLRWLHEEKILCDVFVVVPASGNNSSGEKHVTLFTWSQRRLTGPSAVPLKKLAAHGITGQVRRWADMQMHKLVKAERGQNPDARFENAADSG